MSQHWKNLQEMMGSDEWAATDKAGRTRMMKEHGFMQGGLQTEKPKSPYRPGRTGEVQRMVQRPFRLGELTEALSRSKREEK